MKNNKGMSLIKLILIIISVIAVLFIISKISQNAEFNRKKEKLKDFNDSVATYNVDVLKKNTIIYKCYPNVSSNLLFQEAEEISLDKLTPKNIDSMVYLYKKKNDAVMEFNDKLLEYYREILQ